MQWNCTTKKEVIYQDKVRVDTVHVKEVVKVQVPGKETIVINDLCDSITKQPVKIRRIFVQNGDSLRILTNERNELIIENIQKDKELQRLDSIVKTSTIKTVSNEKIIAYRKNWLWIFSALVVGFLLGLLRSWRFLS
jgi:hypothetical protein